MNFFQPSFKLHEKIRDGASVTKRYHPPLTPFQRVQEHPAITQAVKDNLAVQFAQLDSVVLLHNIRQSQERLKALADTAPPTEKQRDPKSEIDAYSEGLRHASKEGDVRPTSHKKPAAPRGRRRPDPLADVTHDLKACFEEDPSKTGRELLSRLQATYPAAHYPDALLRTVQRRLKIWRSEIAHAQVFTNDADESAIVPSVVAKRCESFWDERSSGTACIGRPSATVCLIASSGSLLRSIARVPGGGARSDSCGQRAPWGPLCCARRQGGFCLTDRTFWGTIIVTQPVDYSRIFVGEAIRRVILIGAPFRSG